MENKIIYIPPVKDCSYVENMDANLAVRINECFTSKNVFRVSSTLKEEDLPILTYDYSRKKWLTGRFIGKLYFTYLNQDYCFEVQPRFGNATVMHLLEEIFNIKLANANSSNKLHNHSQNELIKKLISLIWVKQLSKASIHGLPKRKVKIQHKGNTIKGHLNIRKSFLPLYSEKRIVSERSEKKVDTVILAILIKAYKILCKRYYLTQNMLSENVIGIINNSTETNVSPVTQSQYENIKYGSIYNNFKGIVDYSWSIISREKNNIDNDGIVNRGDALFLDMAEIWEKYLLTILKKRYSTEGWRIYSSKFIIYEKQFYRRGLVPDIVFERGNQVMVFDAKYKNMSNSSYDYDRSDFFQIHTYGSFMQANNKNLIGIGLLYPLKKSMDIEQHNGNFSEKLFGQTSSKTWFNVDGIELSETLDQLILNRDAFFNRFDEKLLRID